MSVRELGRREDVECRLATAIADLPWTAFGGGRQTSITNAAVPDQSDHEIH